MISESFMAVHAWLAAHSGWLGPAIGLVALVESLLAIGLIVPGVALLFALAALAGSGLMSLEAVLVWAFIGAALGDGISFQVGAKLHDQLKKSWPFSQHPEWLDKGEQFFVDYGGLSIALGRFVGPIRPVIPAVAGMMDMKPLRFYSINLLSAIPWAFVYMIPGYFTGAAMATPLPESFYGLIVGLFLLACVVSVALGIVGNRAEQKGMKQAYLRSMLSATALCLFLLVFVQFSGLLEGCEQWVYSALAEYRQPSVVYIFSYITSMGGPEILWLPFVVAIAVLLWQKNSQKIKWLLLCVLGSETMIWLLKWLIDKPRPEVAELFDPFSFPSGHTAHATLAWLLIIFLLAQGHRLVVRISAYSITGFLILLVALSRLLLNVHWLGDVLAGLVLGGLWFCLYVLLDQRREQEKVSADPQLE